MDDFMVRRDNRGLMIARELKKRYDQMENLEPEVQKLFDYKQKQRYGSSKNSGSKS